MNYIFFFISLLFFFLLDLSNAEAYQCPVSQNRTLIFYYNTNRNDNTLSYRIRHTLEEYRNELLGYGVKLYYRISNNDKGNVDCCFNDRCKLNDIRLYKDINLILDIPFNNVLKHHFLHLIDPRPTLHSVNGYLKHKNGFYLNNIYSNRSSTSLIGVISSLGYEEEVIKFYNNVNSNKTVSSLADYFIYTREDKSHDSIQFLSYLGHEQINHGKSHYYIVKNHNNTIQKSRIPLQ